MEDCDKRGFILDISTILSKQLANAFEWPKINQRKRFDSSVKTICIRVCTAEEYGAIILNNSFFHVQNSPPKGGGGDYS